MPRVVDGVGGRAAVCLVPLVFEVDEVGVGQVEEVVHEVAERVSAEAEGRLTGATFIFVQIDGAVMEHIY